MNKFQQRLAYIEGQIAQAQAYVTYWVGMATSGAIKQRKIFKTERLFNSETRNIELTDDEKIAHAMETAHRHVQRIIELTDARDKMFEEAEKNDSQ